jgi:serine/threonine-protein phosphatase 2A regulatory subunit B
MQLQMNHPDVSSTKFQNFVLRCALVFEIPEDPNESEFAGVIASISHMMFDPSGDKILARDYMTVKLWDIRQESEPLKIIPIHDYLEPKLGDLYQNECIFDKFECAISSGG